MRALIVYESMFGNCQRIAQAVTDGLIEAGGSAEACEVSVAPTEIPREVDLLVVGGPNHFMALPSPQSRIDAESLVERPLITQRIGLREWLIELQPNQNDTMMAIFDCRLNHPDYINNHEDASLEVKMALYEKGFEDSADPLHVLVEEKPGPLVDGELERASAWGAVLID